MTKNPSSNPPHGSDLPDNGLQHRRLNVDQFFEELKGIENGRKILRLYLGLDGGDVVRPLIMRHMYGEVVDHVAYKVEELIKSYGSNYDAVRRVLQARLEAEEADTVEAPDPALAKEKQTVVPVDTNADPHEQTMVDSSRGYVSPWAAESPAQTEDRTLISTPRMMSDNEDPNFSAEAAQDFYIRRGMAEWTDSAWVDTAQPHPLKRLLETMLEGEREAIDDYLQVDRNNPKQVQELAKKHGVFAMSLDYQLEQEAKKIGCSVEDMRWAVSKIRRGEHVDMDQLRPKVIIKDDPRRAATIISTRKERGLLSRLFGGRGKKTDA